jgi:hypothetical protein
MMNARTHRRSGFVGLLSLALGGGFMLSIMMIAAAAAEPANKGPIPDAGFLPSGELDARLVPDFVSVYGRDGVSIAGYVPKAYLLRTNMPSVSKEVPRLPDIPVYGEDLTSLVGHMVPDKGFVPLGVDPATIPSYDVEVGGK